MSYFFIGNSIFRRGGGQSWSSYWSHQTDTFLFFGQIKNISGGQLANEMEGATDYLTVGGSAGSWTFQAPNTADYKTADSDYIFFDPDGTQRTATEAELIAYDFGRTIVYYDDVSPYALRVIAILKPTASVSNKMRTDFHLSVWWDDTLSIYGNVKGNRGSQRSIRNVFTYALSHFDGDNNATEYSDLLMGAWSFVGAAKLSTAQSKFGTSVLDCSASASAKVTIADNNALNFGADDFTIEFWFYPLALNAAGSNCYCSQTNADQDANSRQIQLQATNKKFKFYLWDSDSNLLASSTGSTKITINAWHHLAVVRHGNTATGYLDGVAECTIDVTGLTLQNGTGDFAISGLGAAAATTYSRSYFDEFRVTKGLARYTGNFTPSTTHFTID